MQYATCTPSATQPATVPDGAEVDVVRMGDDDQGALDGCAPSVTGCRGTACGWLSSDCLAAMPAPPPRMIPRMSGVSPPVVSSSPSSATAAVPPATFHRPDTYSLVAPPETPRLRAALFSIAR